MSSKIEQMIDQIEDFIDSCRYQTFSKTKIRTNSTLSSKSSAREYRTRSVTISALSPTRSRSLKKRIRKRTR